LEKSGIQTKVSSPVKILDVPSYGDDFYVNNIDWSEKGPVGIALGSEVFLYSPDSVSLICTAPFKTQVSGIKLQEGLMGVGLSTGAVEIYDVEKACLARTLHKHQLRVSALTFVDGLLVSGSKDRTVVIHDLRQREHVIREFTAHKGEICTLKTKNKF
jgi:WD40 repeat protein